mmetsp:Transcript_33197/g.71172  ORF Transcript_33197/g.71172 Transcript_33197/m.71172 type:complete len:225 (+) Transcript_33197:66-740(+)
MQSNLCEVEMWLAAAQTESDDLLQPRSSLSTSASALWLVLGRARTRSSETADAASSTTSHASRTLGGGLLLLLSASFHQTLGRCEEGHIDVGGGFRGRGDEEGAYGVRFGFALLFCDLELTDHVRLVADEDLDDVGPALVVLLDLCQPLLDVVEGSTVRCIVDKDKAVRVSVVVPGDDRKALLTSCIPKLQFHQSTLHHRDDRFEVDANCRHMEIGVVILHEPR